MVKRDFITSILLGLSLVAIFILLRLFVFKPYTIRERDSNSYLHKGDYIVVAKNQVPDYGDFVLYMVDGKSYIGRVMGQSGDSLTSIEDILYRNQEVVDQTFIKEQETRYLSDGMNDLPFTEDFSLTDPIPQDNYFILNDDRQNLEDSRQFGLIPRSKIKGVLTFRLLPIEQFGFVTVE